MHALTKQDEDWNPEEDVPSSNDTGWVMKKLKPKHKEICALLAQGFKNVHIARLVGVTPEYICMLQRQPLIQGEVARICEIAGTRMEALFEQSVEVVAEVLQNGKHGDKLKAARLQMEVTGRVGSKNSRPSDQVPADERLERLAGRLIGLLATNKGIADASTEGGSTAALEGEFRNLSGLNQPEKADGQFESQSSQISRKPEGPPPIFEG